MSEAVTWTARLFAFSWLLQALELWRVRRDIEALYPWSLVRRDYGVRFELPLTWSIVLQGLLALGLLLPHAGWAWAALLVALAQAARFRGSYNGGSDAMTLVVLLGLTLARSVDARLGLAYIAAQLVLSYFLAGVAKLRDPGWRDGSALAVLLAGPPYRDTPLRVPRVAAYVVLAFECTFPLALLDVRLCGAYALAGLGFHALNARVLGLNRFLWAWLAAYPALFAWSVSRP